MVNMNACLTHLVKDKLDRPYWELIANSILIYSEVFCCLQKGCVLENVSV
jgi:hypothetical protein